jgi:hypothetical protein
MAKKCPPGQILVKGSSVKSYVRADGVRVKASKRAAYCVPDKGAKGKTPASKKVLPKLKEGALAKYGLHDLEHMTVTDRMKGYEKAVKAEGYASLVARLNVLANYTKKSNPKFHKLVRADMERIKKKLAPIYSKSMRASKGSRKSSRKASRKGSKKGSKSKGKEVKAGSYKTRDGKSRQLYRLQDSKAKYYKYRSADGKMKKRYI